MTATPASPKAPTQVRRPWRTTLRTVLQTIVGTAAAVPLLLQALPPIPAGKVAAGVAALGAAAGVITRVSLIPAVNRLLTRFGVGASPTLPPKNAA